MLQGSEFKHISVLLRESMEALNIKPDGVYVDCTAGGGGHSAAIAARLSPEGTLISIDKDDSALGKCMLRREECFANINWMPVKSDYGDIDDVLDSMKIKRVDGILADLGVSSYQLDTAERGFSYMHDGPLDMRMDTGESLTAADVVNRYTREQLIKVFTEYGEERHAARIAEGIIERRKVKPFRRTVELAEAIKEYEESLRPTSHV